MEKMIDRILKRTAVISGVFLAFLVIFFQGCVPQQTGMINRPPQPDSREIIGTLQAMGDRVFVNHRPASTGMRVYNGDNVSTGENSKAIVRFLQGGFVELDENTDPDFIKKAYCLFIKVFRGQVYVEGKNICIETP